MGGCNCNCLMKDPESNHEMINGAIPGLGVSNRDNMNEIMNIVTENDNEGEDNNIYEKEKNNENKISENINTNLKNNEIVDDNKINNLNNSLSLEEEEYNKKKENLDKLKISSNQTRLSRNTPRRMISYDSSEMSQIQNLCESIFDYFNEIRTKPDNFEKIEEENEILEILQKVINGSNPCNTLINNNFYNLLLTSYINDYTNDGEDNNKLLEEIEKEEKLKNYTKKIFVEDGDINNPNGVVWKLIEKNKNIALETFFSNSIDCLVISCQKINKQKFKCFFLFLSKKI